VGITFGDYLRAIVTADHDLNPDDTYGYRLAFVESFRQWGISPKGMRSMSVESLLWPTGDQAMDEAGVAIDNAEMNALVAVERAADDYKGLTATKRRGRRVRLRPWDLDSNRYNTWEGVEKNSAALWAWLVNGPGKKLAPAIGIVLDNAIKNRQTIFRSPTTPGALAVEVHSVRTALRRTVRGATVSDLVVEITQRRRGYFDAAKQAAMDKGAGQPPDNGDFRYRAGCTLLIDPQTMTVRRVIKTAGDIADNGQLDRVRRFLAGDLVPNNAFERARAAMTAREPFALLHRDGEA
jgi:hypothetical protein